MTHHYGWADLDNTNRNHYGRGKSAEILEAEINAELVNDTYLRLVNEYYDNHYGDAEFRAKLDRAKLEAIKADERVLALKRQQYPASEPVITGDQEPAKSW